MSGLNELQEFLDEMTKPVQTFFDDLQKEDNPEVLTPMWFLEHGPPDRSAITMVTIPFNEGIRESMSFLKAKIEKLQVHRLVHISETWVTELGASPASHPDRRKAIVAIAEDKAGNIIHKRYFILRPEHGPAVLAPPETELFGAEIKVEKGGGMSNLLDY